jgi:hypothetical protein
METAPDHHSVFTIIAPVTGPADGVEATLAAIGNDPVGAPILPLGAVDGLHYASMTLLEGSAAQRIGRSLVIELNADGPVDSCLAALIEVGAKGLDALFGATPGWPGAADTANALAFLREHVRRPGAYHVGNTARSVGQIQLEAAVWDHIQRFLDDNADLRTADGETIWTAIRDSVAADPLLAEALLPASDDALPQPSPHKGTFRSLKLVLRHRSAQVARLVLRFPWLLVREFREKPDPSLANPQNLPEIEATEDLPGTVQNHLTSVVDVKRGVAGRGSSRFRMHVLDDTLAAIEILARRQFVDGQLGGISSIHFAHWVVIDDGRRLLFVSNFDGSWESYLDDFIELAHIGLTAVWSNAEGFPRTHGLVFGGATHGEAFKRWARRSQQITPVWFHAYPELSVTQVDVNSRIRTGLATRPKNDKEMTTWLRLL